MRLARELGVMALDPEGRWLKDAWSISDMQESVTGSEVHGLIDSEAVIEQGEGLELLPPEVSDEVVDFVEALPEDFKLPIPDTGTKSERANTADSTNQQESPDESSETDEAGQLQPSVSG